MCLILVAHRPEEPNPLLVLANRDEFYRRPSEAADYWQESPTMIAGRDLVSGGTWFGVNNQRWSAVTNIREGVSDKVPRLRSRGWLVRDYLLGDLTPADYLTSIQATKTEYAGFNLLLGDGNELWYTTNRGSVSKRLEPGIYGLSNHLLDTPWPKVVRGKEALGRMIKRPPFDYDGAFTLLADTTCAPAAELPDTGIPLEWEHALSAIFIVMPSYGTRCSTLLMTAADGQHNFIERRYNRTPQKWQQSEFSWKTPGKFA
jgi:uncharacterized protein with NRDE domain